MSRGKDKNKKNNPKTKKTKQQTIGLKQGREKYPISQAEDPESSPLVQH